MNFNKFLFKYRSYTPIPLLLIMLIFSMPSILSISIGLMIMLLGETIRFWGVSIVGVETRVTKTGVGATSLITNGPFAYVRNPLYIGNILLYVGACVMSMALFPWLLIATVIGSYVQYYFIIRLEEEYLINKYGDKYKEYSNNVSRFMPKLRPYQDFSYSFEVPNIKEGLTSEKRTLQAIFGITICMIFIYFCRH
ncbi:MAG: isoprenylcysteine carboxylmethyltransferase family protein [Elusimicrobia bacterium]|nr:isoprenylcysteine carboxylmethyltransferase family protein [Elusimicrobiota bacterium]